MAKSMKTKTDPKASNLKRDSKYFKPLILEKF